MWDLVGIERSTSVEPQKEGDLPWPQLNFINLDQAIAMRIMPVKR